MTDLRVEHIGEATLYLGDCREILPTLGKVDAVVTDPPYGIGFKYESHKDDAADYPGFIWPIIEAAEALVMPGGPVFVWQAQEWFPHFHRIFPRKWRVYISAKNFVQIRNTPMQHAYEPVLVWWKDGGKPWWAGKSTKRFARDYHIADSASAVSDTTSLAKLHPCPRQIDAVENIIGNWVAPKSTALDPFMGSGTTGVACANLGRKFIGIEIEPKYFDVACRRIDEAYKQPRLFEETQPPPIRQGPLFAEENND